MNLQKLESELIAKYNNGPIISSYLTFLRCCYEVASEKKQYLRAYLINDLISNEINA